MDIINKYASFLEDDDKNNIDIDEENLCSICCNEISEKYQELKCGHKFCDTCIKDWYKKLHSLCKTNYSNYKKKRECPACRQDGGYLKIREFEKPIKDIHKEYTGKNNSKFVICGAPFTSKKGTCQCKGKEEYGWYCGRHKKYAKLKPKKI